jgi:carboxymethylenebutenolidase
MLESNQLIEFSYDGGSAKGYMVKPSGEALSRPALLVIHEWWGLNEHIGSIAERYANEGYVVLAPDLYGGKVTRDPEEAGRLMQALEAEKGLSILNGAVDFLKATEGVDANRIGITGFCMGGTFALLLACKNEYIKAAAPFYGDVPQDDVLKDLKAPVLFIGAENDFWITSEKMTRLSDALAKYEKLGEVKIYGGVGHGFFNDTRQDVYNPDTAQAAWNEVNRFFAGYLK